MADKTKKTKSTRYVVKMMAMPALMTLIDHLGTWDIAIESLTTDVDTQTLVLSGPVPKDQLEHLGFADEGKTL